MASPDRPYRWDGGDLILRLKVTPGASKEEFALVDDQLRAWLHARPQGGKANEQLVKVMSKQFRVPQSSVTIVSGETGRRKVVRITEPGKLPNFIECK